MKNRWIKILSVLFIGVMCVSMSACQNSKEEADDSSAIEVTVEDDETDEIPAVEEEMTVDTDPITEQDVIEESTAVYDEEFLGAEESELDEIDIESVPEMEDAQEESAAEEEEE